MNDEGLAGSQITLKSNVIFFFQFLRTWRSYFQSSHIDLDLLKAEPNLQILSTLLLIENRVSVPSGGDSSLLTSDRTYRYIN